MNFWFSLFVVIGLAVLALVGAPYLGAVFGIWIPYAAVLIFAIGFIARVFNWARIPVPFRIPTTCGQAKSLPMFKQDKLDCPYSTWQVIGRMALEVLLFRSLFRNTRAEIWEGNKVTYASAKWLWLAGILFHYSFLIIVIRHMRFFTEPVPWLVNVLAYGDGFFELLLPTLFITDLLLILAVTYLFLRRVLAPQIRYISLSSDYFPLLLILGIAITGVLMRNVYKVDLMSVKQLAVGLVTFAPVAPEGIGAIFYCHLFLVSVLLIYFPFSKLMHMGGVFMSPTRNMANNNRAVRHINPWNYPVKLHTYEEYEEEFGEKMKEVGIPLDKE